jgi:alkanesulfonate monooxygenase SsuD/methylene tetrahydromethanopterin reductase-like flavin-dependent oxidoreductase (luciferase family)
VGIIRSLHSGQTVTHRGEHYQLDECELAIEPVQQPIPLLLGGGGPRMLRFAARHADIVALVPQTRSGGGVDSARFSASAFNRQIAVLDDSVGSRADAGPERGVLLFYAGRSAGDVPSGDEAWASREILIDSPYALVGDTDQMVETLLQRRERLGLSYFTCWEEDIDVLAPVVSRLAGT